MALIARGPKGIFHAIIWANGKPKWRSTKTADRDLAKKKEAEFLLGYSPVSSKMPWVAFKERYLTYSRREKSPKTNETDQQVVTQFETALNEAGMGLRTLSDFNKESAEVFREERKASGLKDSSINRALEVLKAMGQWAEDQDPPILEVNPLRKLKKKKLPKRKGRPYSREEMKRLAEDGCWDNVDRVMVGLGYYAGKRRKEVALMKRSQIDFDAKVIFPNEERSVEKDEGLSPLVPALEKILRAWFKESPKGENVIELNGRPLRPEYITLNFRRIVKRADVVGSFHRLRHTFISRLREANINMDSIRDMVGHSNVTTTQGYSWAPIPARKIIEKAL